VSPRVSKARALVREDIPRVEQVLGSLILIGLLTIGLFIVYKGRHFDPHRFSLDPKALESTRSEIEGKAGTVRADDLRSFELAASQAAPAAQPASSGRNLPAMVEGMAPMGATEHYRPDTLYEKINGRAPAYLEFNFQELTCRSFTIDSAPGNFIDVFIFTMDSPLNAFGIFSLERDDSAIPVDFIRDGYQSEMGYFFRQGSAYVQVLASDSSAAVMDPAEAFARSLAASIPVDDSGLDARSLLPTDHQVADSINYLQTDAYGLSLLKDVYEARYTVDGRGFTFFAMQAAGAEEASAAWDQITEFNRSYAEVTEQGELAGANYLISDNFGDWNVYFMKGQAVGGVINAPDQAVARRFIESYLGAGSPEPSTTEGPGYHE